jgi:hypothetical protein
VSFIGVYSISRLLGPEARARSAVARSRDYAAAGVFPIIIIFFFINRV